MYSPYTTILHTTPLVLVFLNLLGKLPYVGAYMFVLQCESLCSYIFYSQDLLGYTCAIHSNNNILYQQLDFV